MCQEIPAVLMIVPVKFDLILTKLVILQHTHTYTHSQFHHLHHYTPHSYTTTHHQNVHQRPHHRPLHHQKTPLQAPPQRIPPRRQTTLTAQISTRAGWEYPVRTALPQSYPCDEYACVSHLFEGEVFHRLSLSALCY